MEQRESRGRDKSQREKERVRDEEIDRQTDRDRDRQRRRESHPSRCDSPRETSESLEPHLTAGPQNRERVVTVTTPFCP